MKDVTVIIPVYKEDPKVVTQLHDQVVSMGAQVIVVNDGNTVNLPSHVNQIGYPENKGYGFALKYGIKNAFTKYVCTADGDGQHTIDDIWKLYMVFTVLGTCKMVIGTRWNLVEPWYRAVSRKLINLFASLLAGHYLVDLNSGLRMMDRELVMNYMPILCDRFSFTTTLTMSFVTDNYRFAYVPMDIQKRVSGKSKVNLLTDGIRTLYYILRIGVALRTRKLRARLRDLRSILKRTGVEEHKELKV